MQQQGYINPNPQVYRVSTISRHEGSEAADEDLIDSLEVFNVIRNINDPEHPLTLEQLNVVKLEDIFVYNDENRIQVYFTPNIPHCSMATLIGLCLRVKLLRSFPENYKVDVAIAAGTHNTEDAINKQLNDKERVAAALENSSLLSVINNCIAHTHSDES